MFCTIAHKFPTTNESRYNRDFSNCFSKDSFLKEISEIDFASLVVDDVNESMNGFAETVQQITVLINMLQFENSRIRACLHGGGGPQVGEVTRLAVVEKWPAFTCKLTTPGSRGDFT